MSSTVVLTQPIEKYLQYTNVKPDATRDDLIRHLETTIEYGFQAAMISMCWVPLGKSMLKGTGVRLATCIGLGLGHESIFAKAAMIRECLALGADEVDYEPNMGFFLSGMYDEFQEEAKLIVQAADGMTIKAMLELGYIHEKDKRALAAKLLDEAGVPWVKNSSGWGPGSEPASPENIALLRQSVRPVCKVKASGKIKAYDQALALIAAGAELLGTSAAPEIVNMKRSDQTDY